jgi:hypothetical protein
MNRSAEILFKMLEELRVQNYWMKYVLIKDYIISGIMATMLASDVVDLWFESQSC